MKRVLSLLLTLVLLVSLVPAGAVELTFAASAASSDYVYAT